VQVRSDTLHDRYLWENEVGRRGGAGERARRTAPESAWNPSCKSKPFAVKNVFRPTCPETATTVRYAVPNLGQMPILTLRARKTRAKARRARTYPQQTESEQRLARHQETQAEKVMPSRVERAEVEERVLREPCRLVVFFGSEGGGEVEDEDDAEECDREVGRPARGEEGGGQSWEPDRIHGSLRGKRHMFGWYIYI
jgi:hypothetical protein